MQHSTHHFLMLQGGTALISKSYLTDVAGIMAVEVCPPAITQAPLIGTPCHATAPPTPARCQCRQPCNCFCAQAYHAGAIRTELFQNKTELLLPFTSSTIGEVAQVSMAALLPVLWPTLSHSFSSNGQVAACVARKYET